LLVGRILVNSSLLMNQVILRYSPNILAIQCKDSNVYSSLPINSMSSCK